MATIDKINEELAELQNDLKRLKSSTDEIGKAQKAASEVVKFTSQYVDSFQKRVNTINQMMDKTVNDFTLKCNVVSKEMESAVEVFKKEISNSRKSITELGESLLTLVGKVDQLVGKISSIDFYGHFQTLESAIEKLLKQHSELALKIEEKIDQQFIQLKEQSHKNGKYLIIVIIIGLISVGLLVYQTIVK